MSYNDDKNPYSNRVEDGWVVNQRYDDWKDGYRSAEKELGWHRNCTETPPPKNKVIFIRSGRMFYIALFSTNDGRWLLDVKGQLEDHEVTDWMKIPKVEE